MKTVLTIAGSDPSGGAGVQADLRTFADFRVRGLSVISALTAQNSKRVLAMVPVSPAFLARQVNVLLEEFDVDCVKVGMLAKAEIVDALTRLIKRTVLRDKKIVLDPVFLSSGGYPLLEKRGVPLIKKLLTLVTVVTPNIKEAEVLSRLRIRSPKDMEEAAKVIFAFGPANVVITGGHLKGTPVDILYNGKKFDYFRSRRIKGKVEKFHGTGCILSSAVAAGLARGRTVKKAVEDAKRYVNMVLRARR